MSTDLPIHETTTAAHPLEAGDRLDQNVFHQRYEAMPSTFRAELIGGIVHVPSPLKPEHGYVHALLMHLLTEYHLGTPGTMVFDTTTAILGPASEPQPDSFLIVSPERGGQMRYNNTGYLEGPPEWIGEVASSTEAIDLHRKKEDYQNSGVQEYLVVALRPERVFWFVADDDELKQQEPDADGIHRSRQFPGLWFDPDAILQRDGARLREVLQQGMSSEEHQQFIDDLANRESGS